MNEIIEIEIGYLFWYIVIGNLFSYLLLAILHYLDVLIMKICNYLHKKWFRKKEIKNIDINSIYPDIFSKLPKIKRKIKENEIHD